MIEPQSPDQPHQLDYATLRDLPPRKLGCGAALGWGCLGTFVGYFASVFVGLVFIGGNQGPVLPLFTLWPAMVVGFLILGARLARRYP